MEQLQLTVETRPASKLSATVAAEMSLGPRFATVIVYGTACPGMSPFRLLVLTIERSDRRAIVSDSVSVSLAALVSMTPAGGATVSVAASVAPGWAGLTQPLKVSVALSRAGEIEADPVGRDRRWR